MAGPGAQRSVGKVSVRVVPDTDGFRQKLRADLEQATAGMRVKIPVDLDTRGISRQVHTVYREVHKETTKVSESFKTMGNSAGRASRSMSRLSRVGLILAASFTAAPPVLGAVSGLLIGIPPLLGAIGAAAGAVALGWEGISNAFSDLGDEVDSLQSSVSATFERSLVPAVNNLEGLLPKLEGGLNKVAAAGSAMFTSFTEAVSSDKGVAQLNTLLNNTAGLLRNLRPMVGNFSDAFLTMASEGSKHFGMLSGMLNEWSADFNRMIQRISDNGTLEKALRGTTDVVGSLLGLFNDLFEEGAKIIGQIGPEMSDFIDSVGKAIKEMLPSLTRLAEALLPALGDILESIAPAISTIADLLATLVEAFNDLPDPIKSVIVELAAMAAAIAAVKKAGRGIGKLGAAFTGFFGGGKKKARKSGKKAGRAYTRGAGNAMEKGAGKSGLKFVRGLKKVPVVGTGILLGTELADAFGWTVTDQLTGQQLSIEEAIGLGFERGAKDITEAAKGVAKWIHNIGKAASNGGKLAVEGLAQVDPELKKLTEMYRALGSEKPFIAASDHHSAHMEEQTKAALDQLFGVSETVDKVKGVWDDGLFGLRDTARSVWDSIVEFHGTSTDQITETVDGAARDVAKMWGSGQEKAKDNTLLPWEGISSTISDMASGAKEAVSDAGSSIADIWSKNQENAEKNTLVPWNDISSFIGAKASGSARVASSASSDIARLWGSGQKKAEKSTVRSWLGLSETVRSESQKAKDKAETGASGIGSAFDFSLFTQGSSIMSSLRSGLSSMLPTVLGFASSIAGQIAAVKGPLSYDRRLLIPAGQAIMEGLYEGLEKNFSSIIRLVSEMAPQLADGFAGTNVGDKWAEDVKRGFPDDIGQVDGASITSRWEGQVDSDGFGGTQDAVFSGVMRAFNGSQLSVDGNGMAKLVNKQNTMKKRR